MASLTFSAFNVSSETGFVPSKDPSKTLPAKFQAWDELIARLPQLVSSKNLRKHVATLPLFGKEDLDECLSTEGQWWRAYSILGYLAHAYVWCREDGTVPASLPENIAVPWCATASHLEVAPVITHCAVALCNWQRTDPEGPLDGDNLSQLFSFTGSQDEEWFSVATVLVELEAAKAVAVIPSIYKAMEKNDCDSLTPLLCIVSETLLQMTRGLSNMKLKCRPNVFYNEFRPFFNGWKGSSDLPRGLLYSGVSDEPLLFAGGNAGQSCSMATLDILLGVPHTGSSKEFIHEQRPYMPGPHRRFLEELDRQPHRLRDFLVGTVTPSATTATTATASKESRNAAISAYNRCLESLIAFRSEHVRIVALYILCQMEAGSHLAGTGGSGVMGLLKALRAAVTACMIPAS